MASHGRIQSSRQTKPVAADELGLSSTTYSEEGVNAESWQPRMGCLPCPKTGIRLVAEPRILAFSLASLHRSPPRLPQSQPLLLLDVLGKVQSVGSRWRQASPHQRQQKQSLA